MRNLTLLMLFLVTATFIGCKKDKKEEPSDNILGKWYIKKTIDSYEENGRRMYEDIETDYDSEDYYVFTSDERVTKFDGDTREISNYKIKGNHLIITGIEDPEKSIEDFEIKKQNSTELVLYSEFTENKNEISSKGSFEITFEKEPAK